MNPVSLIEHLSNWSTEENLYRDFFYMNDSDKKTLSLNKFIDKYKLYPEYLKDVLHPELIPSQRKEEEAVLLQANQNVSILKHPRYFPFYYHEHNFFEMIYVVSGQCTQRFQTKHLTLMQGDIFIIAPGIRHGIEVFNDESIILNFLIRKSTFLDIFMNTVRDKSQIGFFFLENIYARKNIPYILFRTNSDDIIQKYIEDMYYETLHEDEYSDRIICSYLNTFFIHLTRRHKNSSEISETRENNTELGNSLINYMINNYASVTLEKLSEHFHYTPSYCSKILLQTTGYNFSNLLTNIKMQQAECFLTSTLFSVAEISDMLGYKNPETFIRAFKRYFLVTPHQYRERERIHLK